MSELSDTAARLLALAARAEADDVDRGFYLAALAEADAAIARGSSP